ncbi:MAG: PEGA domain-containing protein [Acidobacteriia bacterium]|nr:PEGA domain-containing protein [Terriglobia bacterium]
MRRIACGVALLFTFVASVCAQDKPRVFITDSQSWEMSGHAGGSGGAFGAETHGGARPQTAEIIKTFGERCPQVTINNIQAKVDYIVLLDHEGGKGLLRHKNKVAVFAKQSGDSVMSKSTVSLGGSVQEACGAIQKHWNENGAAMRAAAAAEVAPQPKPTPSVAPELAKSASPKLFLASTPEGADIEIDGNFMGSTPSAIELASGDHLISIKKSGYKTWERKLKLTGGEIKVNAELEKSADTPKAP